MASRSRRITNREDVCAEPGPDDGLDPRIERRRALAQDQRPDRKARQLCKQVEHCLQLSLYEIPQAELLVGAIIESVIPAPNSGRLAVVLSIPDATSVEPVTTLVHRHAARLRTEVAAAITRRRAPELIFQVIARAGDA